MNRIILSQTRMTLVVFMSCLITLSGYSQGGLKQAEDLYSKYAYFEAAKVFESSMKKGEGTIEQMSHLANCYRLTNQYEQAERWYSRVAESGSGESLDLLYYSQILQINGKYGEAAKWYSKYRESVPSDGRAENQLKACQNYRQFFVDADQWEIKNLPFNSSGYDFSPAIYKEGLVYTTSRDSAKAIEREATWIGQSFYDIYYTSKGSSTSGSKAATAEEGSAEKLAGNWSKPKSVLGDGNTKYHDGPVCFTEDEGTTYFTRNNYKVQGAFNKWGKSSDNVIKLKMYEAKVNGDKWTDIKDFAYNNDEYSVGHPALSKGDSLLYFVSDMPGGYGGTDLYVCKREGSSWGSPENLGPEVNTEGDEMFPYVDSYNDLYFASDGHGGLGGLDVFKVKGSLGEWGKVKNIGSPINSAYDDFGFVYEKDRSKGFFTSDRPGGHGSDDIYSFKNESILLEGIVYDKKTGEPICRSDVDLKYKNDVVGEKTTECDGYFEFSVLAGRDYHLDGCAEGYKCNGVDATTKGVKPGEKVFVKIPLEKEEKCKLEVLVIDKRTKDPIASSKVIVYGDCDQTTQRGTSDLVGQSYYDVKCNECVYNVSGNAEGYLPGDVDVKMDGNVPNSTIKAVVELTRIGETPPVDTVYDPNNVNDPRHPDYKGQKIVLRHIYYDFDKWFIRKEAEVDLYRVLDFMKENPDAIVEIGSHTDARASYEYNINLSEKRAKSAVQWLIKHGASKKKLQAKGYGETELTNKCADNIQCSEDDHQHNRRTEFRVIGTKVDQKSIERFDVQIDPCTKCPF
jgi:outer membrane protein OmpA-like peptidoglycan-associated protein/tetratricopeptide (TPR) repeat protein